MNRISPKSDQTSSLAHGQKLIFAIFSYEVQFMAKIAFDLEARSKSLCRKIEAWKLFHCTLSPRSYYPFTQLIVHRNKVFIESA